MWALEFSASRVPQIHDVHPQKITHQAPHVSKLEAAVQVVSVLILSPDFPVLREQGHSNL